jgi:hypothetical protein
VRARLLLYKPPNYSHNSQITAPDHSFHHLLSELVRQDALLRHHLRNGLSHYDSRLVTLVDQLSFRDLLIFIAAAVANDPQPNLGYTELYKLTQQFYDTFQYPNNVKEAQKINSTIFADNVRPISFISCL